VVEHEGSSWLADGGATYRNGVVLTPGLHGSAKLVVAEEDTALALHSGDVAVLGTPRLIALAEEAALVAVADHLPPLHTTVGMRVQIDRVEGRRLTFTVTVSDSCGLVAAGKVTRVIVETERFLEKAR
jgi:fluoroacetyl-CoA thioesterase